MSAYDEKEPKVDKFSVIESVAVKFIAGYVFDVNADVDHNLRTVVARFAGPHKHAVLDHESYGAMIRALKVQRFLPFETPPWRQRLVDAILAYRQNYPQWGALQGGGAQWMQGRTALRVNFHELDRSVFPDEWVVENVLARTVRFMLQRRLFGVAMNTDLETQNPAVHAHTDWQFTGQPPFVPTVREGVWIGAPVAPAGGGPAVFPVGMNPDTFHGFAHQNNPANPVDNEAAALPASHQPGNANWNAFLTAVPWLPAWDDPVLYPIHPSYLQYVVRAKDINSASSEGWRERQPTPAAGQPPLAAQNGVWFLGNCVVDGVALRASQLFTHGPDLKHSIAYRPNLICSRNQFDHNALETGRALVSCVDYQKVQKAEMPWFAELSGTDLTTVENAALHVIRYLKGRDRFAPKHALREAINEKLKAPGTSIVYDLTHYVSVYLEAIEKIAAVSQRLPAAERVTDAQKLDRACVELVKFAKMAKSSHDKLCDEYIDLFTIYANKDEPQNAARLDEYFGTFERLKSKVLNIEADPS